MGNGEATPDAKHRREERRHVQHRIKEFLLRKHRSMIEKLKEKQERKEK